VGGVPLAIAYQPATTTGGTTPVTVVCTPGTGTSFSAGTTSVLCTASDSGGRQASCAFGVTVTSVTPRLLKTRFMTFGDSLTEGDISSIPLSLDAGPHSYPSTLRRLLTLRYTAQTVTVVNEGVGGEHAASSFDRLEGALRAHNPEAVLLMHGVNDLNATLSVQSTFEAVDELVDIARDAGLTTFVATLPPLGPGPKAACPACVAPLNQQIRSMAAARGAFLVDVHAAWGGQSGLMGGDGIHPTPAGYEVIAQAFFDAIQRNLEAPAGMTIR
jgi:lysophospholipase L1-like esterase